ncbi:thioredoxin family protein [Tenacibaculum piscium]|uniref:thioredoxin family protein n=1 Tax=Tenacibaculum piscium TaxID=1458515 RepID=UPI001F2AB8D0|nr:thioredoxin family protein [Tenacibaculum piscium]
MNKIIILFVLISLNISSIIAQEWHTDFNTSKAIATKENKTLILVFQGSDWCIPCIKLNKQVWNTDVFKKYAKENYVMLQVDFPRKRRNNLSEKQATSNAKLFEKYNKNGILPFVVVLDSKGKVLGETGYKKISPENYLKELNTFIK